MLSVNRPSLSPTKSHFSNGRFMTWEHTVDISLIEPLDPYREVTEEGTLRPFSTY